MPKEDFLENWESFKNYIKGKDSNLFKQLNKITFNQYTHKVEIVETLEDLVMNLDKSQKEFSKFLLILLSDANKL